MGRVNNNNNRAGELKLTAINSFQVNDESVENMSTGQIIDLLRIIRGAICLTILRKEEAVAAEEEEEGQAAQAAAEAEAAA